MRLSDRSHRHTQVQLSPGDRVHWWRAGGTVRDADTIEAWQAVCQPNYAASLVGLVNGGIMNDFSKAGITWSDADGWIGDGNGYFKASASPVFPYESGSEFVRYSGDPTPGYLFGASDGVSASQIRTYRNPPPLPNGVTFWNGAAGSPLAVDTVAGIFEPVTVVGFSGRQCYINGVRVGSLPAGGAAIALNYDVMARNLSGIADGATLASVQAIAFYSIALSDSQAAILSALMLNLCQRRPFILDQSALDGGAELQ